ncbi:ABC transporter ATP-binding protein [Tetzosporium hominis]|uniref:ABC transporter ATP-binding protein n=1 Tax=Tetzosporium hominis TaxID=2020506 RepID=A0A264W024_9BACL|nr:ABC transporter ATP-binding protein [Tetzosporium hominis]OZS76905.1 ABC transporter ATP-binding protein [Tetzosporium hominis]
MILISELNHTFKIGKKGQEKDIPVLRNVNLDVAKGEIVAILGKSGSGKSTLLNLLAGFMTPESGSIKVNDEELVGKTETEKANFRLQNYGFIFQSFQLMPGLTAFENIELPLKLQGVGKQQRMIRVKELLQQVGLTDVSDHYPNELSGGQQQRVSIARALIGRPSILLADEPTGSLDSETEQEILQLIQLLNQHYGITFVIITHDEEVARSAHRQYRMHDGAIQEDMHYVS